MSTAFAPEAWPAGESEMARRIRVHDWTATPLGAIKGWPQSLRTAVDIVLAMPSPATVVWGPHHLQIHNDAYVTIARDRHPALLGRPLVEGWPEVFDAVLAPLLESAYAGRATRLTDFPVSLKGSDGQLEERLFDTDWSPIRDETGMVAGALQTLVETTDRFKAQTALRESEARHRLLIGSWAQAIWETDAGGVVVADSPSWRAYTGQTPEEWLGYGWLNAIHPDDRSYAEWQWREAIKARGLADAEFRLRAAGGGWCWTNVRATPVLDASGRVAKWAGINIDIDARKRAEANAALLAGIADDLTRLTMPDEIIEAAGRRMGEALNLNLCLFADVDEARGEVDVHHAWQSQGSPNLKQQRFRIADFLTDEFAQSQRVGETFVVRDTVTDERTDAEAYARLLVGSILAVPFHRDGRWVAYLTVTDAAPRNWRSDEVAVVRDVADRVFPRIERARAEAALRKSEERFRALSTAGGNSIYRMSPDWRLMYQLDSDALPVTSAPIEDWVDKYIPPDDLPSVRAAITQAIRMKSLFELEHRVRLADGGIGWVRSRAVPLFDEVGEVTEWFGAGSDVTHRKVAEIRLREREADLARVQRIGGVGGLDIDVANGLTSRRSPEYMRLHGLPSTSAEETHAQWRDRVHPEDRERAERDLFEALNGGGGSYEAEYRIVRPNDGAVRWIHARADIERDSNGKPMRLVGAHLDVTDQKHTQEALVASEERFRGFGEASTDVLWIRDAGTLAWIYLTSAFETIYGLPREKALAGNTYSNWIDLIVAEDREQAMAAIDRVRAGGRVTFEYRVRRPSDGVVRWLRNTDFPIRDGNGAIVAIGGIGHDVTDEKEAASRMEVLVAELQHRTRNLIGVVRAIADRTAAGTSDLQDFLSRFRERLGALSRINGLLSKLDRGARITFNEMLRTELVARGFPDGVSWNVTLDGPADVRLRSATVQTFALAIHELTTNAVKYGALSEGTGRLRVSWRLTTDEGGAEHLRVEWLETGVANMSEPENEPQGGGYGRMLIEKALPYQLGATTTYEHRRDDIRCTIDLPLRRTLTEDAHHV